MRLVAAALVIAAVGHKASVPSHENRIQALTTDRHGEIVHHDDACDDDRKKIMLNVAY
jgi:hypothetical protein